jgi:hypothetical protein
VQQQVTGDALVDDFAGELEIDDDDVALTQADKQRRIRRQKARKKARQ